MVVTPNGVTVVGDAYSSKLRRAMHRISKVAAGLFGVHLAFQASYFGIISEDVLGILVLTSLVLFTLVQIRLLAFRSHARDCHLEQPPPRRRTIPPRWHPSPARCWEATSLPCSRPPTPGTHIGIETGRTHTYIHTYIYICIYRNIHIQSHTYSSTHTYGYAQPACTHTCT